NLILLHNESQKTKSGKHPMIDYELLKKYSDGLIVLTGCLASPVAGPAAQTGVVAQLFLDELNLASAIGPALNDEDLEDLEHLFWDYLEARSAQRKDIAAQLEREVDRIGRRLDDRAHDELRQILDTAKAQANEDAIESALDDLHQLADRTCRGTDTDTIADIEDLIFDAIACADAEVSEEHVQQLLTLLNSLDQDIGARDFTHLAQPMAQLRSGVVSSLANDAISAIETSKHPVAAKHRTIKRDALEVFAHTGETITADTVEDIVKAIDVIDHGNDRSRTVKQKKSDKEHLIDMLYGIIEQAYVNELSDSLTDGLLFMI